MSPVEFTTEQMADALAVLDTDPRWINGSYQERAELLLDELRRIA